MNHQKKKESNQEYMHCPECQKRRMHYRRISGGMEVWTCNKCHHIQSYLYREGAREEDE